MKIAGFVASIAALASAVQSQTTITTKYCDKATTICYTSFTASNGIAFRVAIPVATTAPFDVIWQISAPIKVGWVAIAWGGAMTNNPLSMAWANGKTTMISSRRAPDHNPPAPFPSYDQSPLSKGCYVNSTHWTATALCKGCSLWLDPLNGATSLNAQGTANLAWASSNSAVTTPSSNTTAFSIHTAKGSWTHDLKGAQSSNFTAWVNSTKSAAKKRFNRLDDSM